MNINDKIQRANVRIGEIGVAKEAMRQALIAQGVAVPVADPIDDYAGHIAAIEGGGGVTVYTVQYVDWDGTVLKSQDVLPGGAVLKPADPFRDEYMFTGWDGNSDVVYNDMVITAQYELSPNRVAIFDYDLSLIEIQNVPTGMDVVVDEPSHEGLVFTGWSDSLLDVQGDRALIAKYDIQGGKTRMFITLTEDTGLSPTFYMERWFATQNFKVDFGDGSPEAIQPAGTGEWALPHTYSSYGSYVITITNIGSLTYASGGLGSNSNGVLRGTYASALTKVYVGHNVTVVRGGLKGTGVSKIKMGHFLDNALQNCLNLINIVIISGGTAGKYVFYGCTNLEKVVFLSNNPQAFGVGYFPTQANPCRIFVPDEALQAYKTVLAAYDNPVLPLSELPSYY